MVHEVSFKSWPGTKAFHIFLLIASLSHMHLYKHIRYFGTCNGIDNVNIINRLLCLHTEADSISSQMIHTVVNNASSGFICTVATPVKQKSM